MIFLLNLGGFYDASIVRIGCHRIENATNLNQEDEQVDGDLSKMITLSANQSNENNEEYCRLALESFTINNNSTQGGDGNGEDNQEQGSDKQWFQVNIEKLSQCIINDAEEVGCDECGVRFYHNILMDSDEIFAPNKYNDETVQVG